MAIKNKHIPCNFAPGDGFASKDGAMSNQKHVTYSGHHF